MITIGDLADDDRAAAHDLGRQAFNNTDAFDPGLPPMEAGRHVAAYDDGRLVGQARRHAFGQYFGGRRLPCAGISGVVVIPEARGRDLARRLLRESMERAAADGEVIAALFPTTASLYRSVGFEVAGWWTERTVPVSELPTDDRTVTWERTALDDPRIDVVYDLMAPDRDGWLDLDLVFRGRQVARALRAEREGGANRYAYIGHRGDEPVAALQYVYAESDRGFYRIDVEALHGVDGDAVRGTLAFLAANGTTVEEVRTTMPVDELALHLPHVQRSAPHRDWPWMLAIVDLPGAIAARGYPGCVTGTVGVEVDDPHRPGNRGTWQLSWRDGLASAERGGEARVEITVTDLAAVFAGYVDPVRLARAGRLGRPTVDDIGLLRAAFAGQPTLTTFF